MKRSGRQEVEIKLRVKDATALKRRLGELGAVNYGTVFECNTLYDTRPSRFRTAGCLLRLRIERRASKRQTAGKARRSWHNNAVLTYKAPVKVIGGNAAKDSRYKIKEELETRIEDPGILEAILKAAGLHPGFRYEKYRTTYRLPTLPRLAIDLDETPIGTFLELEGSRKAIDQVAEALGYTREGYSAASYWEVYRESCRRRGVPVGNMVFKGTNRREAP